MRASDGGTADAGRAGGGGAQLSRRLYAILLAAYPRAFRREYGREMLLVFAERCRDESRTKGRAALARVWRETLFDLAHTAARERVDAITRGGGLMRILRTVVLALLAYAFALLVAAPLYVRNREAMPGFVNSLIDALISTGVLFNVVFLILTLPRFMEGVRAVRAALVITTLLIVALITLMVIASGPPAYPNLSIIVAQVLSLLVWFSVHLWWVLRKRATGSAATV